MFELPATQFDRLIALFDPNAPNSTMAFSTLEGRTPGRAYVDSLANPTRALLVIRYFDLAFVGGALDQPWLDHALAELRHKHDVNLTWSPQVEARLMPPATPSAVTERFEFYDRPATPLMPAPLPLPEGCRVQSIDEALFARCLWREELLAEFVTPEDFLRHGIGLCLMAGDEIYCEAYAGSRGAGKIEIGAITHEEYRQRGFAHLTCQHLIAICEGRGWPTYWSCDQDNAASTATARKLGYRIQKAYKFLHYPRVASPRDIFRKNGSASHTLTPARATSAISALRQVHAPPPSIVL